MTRFRHLFLALLLPGVLSASAEQVHLHYWPDRPVLQTSRMDVDISAPGLLSVPAEQPILHASQEVQAVLEVKGSNGEPIERLPVELSFALQSLNVGVEANGRSVHYSTSTPDSSEFMKEVAKSLNSPVRVQLGPDFSLDASSEDFLKLVRDMEKLEGFRLNNLISEMFQQLFAVAGENLAVGQAYTQTLALGGNQGRPFTVKYEIAGITDKEVRALVSGGFTPLQIPVSAALLGGGRKQTQDAMLKLSGRIEGKAVWSRHNALIYKTRLEYLYDGELVDGKRSLPIQVRLRHQNATKAL